MSAAEDLFVKVTDGKYFIMDKVKFNCDAYIFDMDHTLINNDCDVSWKRFVVEEGLAGGDTMCMVDKFFMDYNNGCLNIDEFMKFQLMEFKGRSVARMEELAREHFERFVRDKIYARAQQLISVLLQRGSRVAILTSTNDVLARPVAEAFGVKELMATQLEVLGGSYSGRYVGVYAAGAGKISWARDYAVRHKWDISKVAFFGDSINDLPVMESVGCPYAVNPSELLRRAAEKNNWPILQF